MLGPLADEILNPKMSLAATVAVQVLTAVEWSAVLVAIAGAAPATMLLLTVGIAVPPAIFQTSQEIVPVSTVAFHAVMVQANGTVRYATEEVVGLEKE
jgi:hypothetical protein